MGLQIQQRNTEAAILARLIQSRTAMDSHIARYLLSLDFEPEDVDRMNSYLHVGNLLTIMQSKSRVYLRTQEGTPSPQ